MPASSSGSSLPFAGRTSRARPRSQPVGGATRSGADRGVACRRWPRQTGVVDRQRKSAGRGPTDRLALRRPRYGRGDAAFRSAGFRWSCGLQSRTGRHRPARQCRGRQSASPGRSGGGGRGRGHGDHRRRPLAGWRLSRRGHFARHGRLGPGVARAYRSSAVGRSVAVPSLRPPRWAQTRSRPSRRACSGGRWVRSASWPLGCKRRWAARRT